MGMEYRVQVTLDGNVIGEGNLTDGLHVRFETTVGTHVFALTDKRMEALAGQGGFGKLLAGVSKIAGGAKAWEMKESFPVGFTAPGHYEVVFEGADQHGPARHLQGDQGHQEVTEATLCPLSGAC